MSQSKNTRVLGYCICNNKPIIILTVCCVIRSFQLYEIILFQLSIKEIQILICKLYKNKANYYLNLTPIELKAKCNIIHEI